MKETKEFKLMNGHNNVFGEVFRFLDQAVVGDTIEVFSGTQEFTYEIIETVIVAERDQPLEVRAQNAEWIAPTTDERLTLISCYPYTSNSHRLIVVAKPVSTVQALALAILP